MLFVSQLKSFDPPSIPALMKPYVTWAPQCALQSNEAMAFSMAFSAFATEYISSGRKLFGVNVILLSDPAFTMQMKESERDHYGKAIRIVLFPIYRWRELNISVQTMIICILEELCHIFYNEDDELNVEDLVTACAKRLWPDVRKEALYDPNWLP